MEDYAKRIEDPTSRFSRILGMFSLKPIEQDFIIMENIVSNTNNALIFDIKGSSHNRFVHGEFDYIEPPYGRVLKDINLVESGFKLHLDPETENDLIQSLTKDFELLAIHEIMDYSVLIAFYKPGIWPKTRYDFFGKNETYSLGIIDILQHYNISKKSEKYIKKIFFRNLEVSSEAPPSYKERISHSIKCLIGKSFALK